MRSQDLIRASFFAVMPMLNKLQLLLLILTAALLIELMPKYSAPIYGATAPAIKHTAYFRFMNAHDRANTDCSPWFPRSQQIDWTPSAKSIVNKALTKIMEKAPGLIERAANGEPITLRLFAGEGTAAETDPCQIAVYTNLLRAPASFVAETLAHEMTHLIDYGCNLSNSRQWNQLIKPTLASYRNAFPDPDALDRPREYQRAQAKMKQLGIPDDYAAENTSEALAEYSAVIALNNFPAATAIKDFIRINILSRPAGINQKAKMMRAACADLNKGNYSSAINGFKSLLTAAPDYSLAYWFMATAFWESKQLPLAAVNLKQSLAIMNSNQVPDYSDDRQRVYSLLNRVERRLIDPKQIRRSKNANLKQIRRANPAKISADNQSRSSGRK